MYERVCGFEWGAELNDICMRNIEYICRCALTCFKEEFEVVGEMMNFPKNYCEESSIILNKFLFENGISEFKLIRGANQWGKFHFWLESETMVIDLTANQFEGIQDPYILIPKNEYPLASIFSKNVQEYAPSKPWDYLENELYPRIRSSFYSSYFDEASLA